MAAPSLEGSKDVLEQPGMVEGVLPMARGFFPTQTIPLFHENHSIP